MIGEAAGEKNDLVNLLASVPVPLFITDKRGAVIDGNDKGIQLMGVSSKEELFRDRKRLRLPIKHPCQSFESTLNRADKKIIDVQVHITPIHLNGKDYFLACLTDITEQKKIAGQLREVSEVYQTVVENSLAAISIHQDGITRFVNRRYAEMLGFEDPSQCIGRPFWASIHPDDMPMVRERGLMREKQQVLPAQYTFREIKQDGTIVWVEIRATHATYQGKPAAVTNFIDITQRVNAEEEIRNLSRRLVRVREDERKKLAADLHDQMGQTLTVMRFDLENLFYHLSKLPEEGKRMYDRLMQNVELLADHLRKATFYMRGDILDQKMLIAVLNQLVEEFKGRHPEIEVNFQSLGFKRRLNPEIELTIYRIFQEALRNISKHARATKVEIMLTYSHPRVILTIRDNGRGFYFQSKEDRERILASGIGIISMKERVASFGGQMEVISAPGKGTMVRFDLPVC